MHVQGCIELGDSMVIDHLPTGTHIPDGATAYMAIFTDFLWQKTVDV